MGEIEALSKCRDVVTKEERRVGTGKLLVLPRGL